MGRLTPRPPYRTAPEPPPAMPVNDPVGSLLRLIGWLWVLVRHDALIPRAPQA